ncbi:MAG: hypothetical protein WCT44_02705 [Candidatus Paceibacterota bacterium]
MIGKHEWFRRRKYTGWGFTPVTWQGWIYVAISILPLVLLTSFPPISQTRIVLIVIWALIVSCDFIDIMIHLPKDERDRIHEAIAERNALWVILAVLIVGAAYQTATGVMTQDISKIDPVILIAVVVGLVVKAVSNFYLDKKN